MKMTGTPLSPPSALRCSHTSYPFISGMLMSSRIRSGGSRRAARSASLPLGTGRTLYARSLSMPASTWRLAGGSSTTRMLTADPPAASFGFSGFKGRSRAEEIEKFLVVEAFGEPSEFSRDARIACFHQLNLRQQLIQIRGDDRFTHRLDQILRPIGKRLGRQAGRRLGRRRN